MDRRNDHRTPSAGTPAARMPGAARPRPPALPEGERPSLATPFAWIGGSLLLTGTTFLVSVIALFQAFASLVR